MIDLEEILDQAFAAPHSPRSLWDFACSLRLPIDGGAHGGERFDPEFHPAQCELLRALNREPHNWERVLGLGPVQDGKTWVLVVILTLYALIELRCSIAIVMPIRSKLDTLWQAKILPAIEINGFANLLPTEGNGSEGATPHEILFRTGGRAYLLSTGTGNQAGLASITVRIVIASEVDDISPADRLDKAWGRADHWQDQALRVEDSTIKHDDIKRSRILRDYREGTISRVHFPCPECGRFQSWEWARVTYDPLDDDTATATARIACLHCGCMLTEAQRLHSLQTRRLVHDGQTVSETGEVVGTRRKTRVFSLRWTALDSPLRSLGWLARAHLAAVHARDAESDHDKLRQFHRDQLCEPYIGDQAGEEGTVKLTPAYLAARSLDHGWATSHADKDSHGLYSRHLAEMPAKARRSGMFVDVQDNRVYWALQAEDDDRSIYDVAWGYEYANIAQQPWNDGELHALFDRMARLTEELTAHTVCIARTIDVAHWQAKIIPWLQRNRGWIPTAGVDHEIAQGMRRNAVPGVPGVIYLHAPTGWDLPGRLLHSIDVQKVREQSLNRYLVAPGKPGSALLPKGLPTNDSWIRHQLAQELVELPSGNRVWRKAKGGGRHDYQDLKTYSEAIFALWHHLQIRPPPNATAQDYAAQIARMTGRR